MALLFMLAVLVGTVVSCDRDSAVDSIFNDADSVMNASPDSALTILRGIDKSLLRSTAEEARYALLMSQALDKNYIDTTDFNVLQPAIDYYLKKGSADEKLRTYYYQGRIYQNRQNLSVCNRT